MTGPSDSQAEDSPITPTMRAYGQILWGQVSERLVLLGAGASIEASMPDGAGLDTVLRQDTDLQTYTLLSDALRQHLGFTDVERVFRVIEHLSDADAEGSLSSDLRRLGLQIQRDDFLPQRALFELERILWWLRRTLWLPSTTLHRALAAAKNEPVYAPEGLRYLQPLIDISLGGTVVTLNYDNTVEEAGGSAVLTTDPAYKRRVVVPRESPDHVRLLKLHGSLDWKQVSDDVIKGGRPMEGEDYRPGVIFGAGNKLRYYGPFLELIRAFVDRLTTSRVVIAIGYSFRDPHVTEALRIWASEPGPQEKFLGICMGEEVRRLPRPVERWQTFEHLRVELMSQKASDLVRGIAGTLT